MPESALVRTNEQGLIRNTDFEKLVIKFNKEAEKNCQSRLNKERMGMIFRTVSSVYWFLNRMCQDHSAGISLSAEEFRIAKAKLDEIALEEVKKWQSKWLPFRLFKLNVIWKWQYYLRNGYFPKEFKLDGSGYRDPWSDDLFEPGVELVLKERNICWYAGRIPPNFSSLTKELFDQGYGLDAF